jgi:hypothetical protein
MTPGMSDLRLSPIVAGAWRMAAWDLPPAGAGLDAEPWYRVWSGSAGHEAP